MTCDYCPRELPAGYVPKVDASGRPVEAVCRPCDLRHMRERAERLGLNTEPQVIH